jgi:FeoC-like transcriptional regulator
MLSAILAAIRDAGKPMCLSDLSSALQIDEPALEGMLETLIARGRLRAIEFIDDGCGTCPVRGGCFIMNDGVAVTYALPPEPAGAERSLPAFS